MANPKKRMSPVRQGNRRRNLGIDLPETIICPDCKTVIKKHTACQNCGNYRGRSVLEK